VIDTYSFDEYVSRHFYPLAVSSTHILDKS